MEGEGVKGRGESGGAGKAYKLPVMPSDFNRQALRLRVEYEKHLQGSPESVHAGMAQKTTASTLGVGMYLSACPSVCLCMTASADTLIEASMLFAHGLRRAAIDATGTGFGEGRRNESRGHLVRAVTLIMHFRLYLHHLAPHAPSYKSSKHSRPRRGGEIRPCFVHGLDKDCEGSKNQ